MNKILLILVALAVLTACSSNHPPSAGSISSQPEPAPAAKTDALVQNDTEPLLPDQIAEAALAGNLAVIEQALAGGFKVDLQDGQGRTSLMYAAFNGHTALVRKIIEAGADVNIRDRMGSTALMFASSAPDGTETVQLLIDAGAGINLADNNEHWTALMWAAAEGRIESVQLLLQHGADTSMADIDGDTAESFAVQNGHAALVKILKNHAAER